MLGRARPPTLDQRCVDAARENARDGFAATAERVRPTPRLRKSRVGDARSSRDSPRAPAVLGKMVDDGRWLKDARARHGRSIRAASLERSTAQGCGSASMPCVDRTIAVECDGAPTGRGKKRALDTLGWCPEKIDPAPTREGIRQSVAEVEVSPGCVRDVGGTLWEVRYPRRARRGRKCAARAACCASGRAGRRGSSGRLAGRGARSSVTIVADAGDRRGARFCRWGVRCR